MLHAARHLASSGLAQLFNEWHSVGSLIIVGRPSRRLCDLRQPSVAPFPPCSAEPVTPQLSICQIRLLGRSAWLGEHIHGVINCIRGKGRAIRRLLPETRRCDGDILVTDERLSCPWPPVDRVLANLCTGPFRRIAEVLMNRQSNVNCNSQDQLPRWTA